MLLRIVYPAFCATLRFLVRGRRGEGEREAELLILRHEVAVLRRTANLPDHNRIRPGFVAAPKSFVTASSAVVLEVNLDGVCAHVAPHDPESPRPQTDSLSQPLPPGELPGGPPVPELI
jgi:hypothetical protein